MTVIDRESREQRRREMTAATEKLKASGALDELFDRIDAGEIELDGRDGLIQQLIKSRPRARAAGRAELITSVTSGAIRPRRCSPNSRNGRYPKTVASQVGDVDSTSRVIARVVSQPDVGAEGIAAPVGPG